MDEGNQFIKKKSALSVQETMDKLESIIAEKGIPVFAKVNHSKNAKDVGLEMNESQVLFFGNPKIGTLMMQQNVFLSLELPLKIAVVKDDAGDVWIVYNQLNSMREKYNLDIAILEKVDALLESISNFAAHEHE
ncbi:MAG: DUF302 domain-containing protein [Candidatus Bathyarchaeota archaeon]|nr:MAG: DUF302 domain-containing protein [Candidatus Bathyarchaeota archaeon]